MKPGFPLGLKNLSLKASDFSTKEGFNLLKAQQRMSPMLQLRAVVKNIQFRSPRCGSIPVPAYRLRTGRSAGAEMVIIPGLKTIFPLGLKNLSLKASDFSAKEGFNHL